MNDNALIVASNKERIKSQIYEIRGYRVMLDSDIAVYFGITTGNLNKAMKRNLKRFPQSFCFQLASEEYNNLIFQFGTSSLTNNYGGRRKLPYAYTEQGVAMLTSVLHTDKAIVASIQIIEAFVEMTHYLQKSQQLITYKEVYQLSNRQNLLKSDIREIKEKMITKNDLPDFIKLFNENREAEEILILNGELFKADVAYQRIYKKAKKSIIVIDDYISTKTLHHLATSKKNVSITIISDNKCKPALSQSEYNDFTTEYPGRSITFFRSANKTHDRYIVLDNGTQDMKVYLCGSSSKDSGKKITTIIQVKNVFDYKKTIRSLLANGTLKLK